jgi:hypothetical protein
MKRQGNNPARRSSKPRHTDAEEKRRRNQNRRRKRRTNVKSSDIRSGMKKSPIVATAEAATVEKSAATGEHRAWRDRRGGIVQFMSLLQTLLELFSAKEYDPAKQKIKKLKEIGKICDNKNLDKLKIIGKGHYGKIYKDDTDYVLKAIYNSQDCNSAIRELELQMSIYEAFDSIFTKYESQISLLDENETKILLNVSKFVRVSKPICSYNKPVIINEEQFNCYFTMELLKGIPISDLEKFKPKIDKTVYLHNDIQVHPLYQPGIIGFVGAQIDKPVSISNAPRGYFANQEITENLLNKDISMEDFENVVRFIYMWIIFKCDIIPYDIEITLGYNESHGLNINVLDFGMTTRNAREFGLDNILPKLDVEPYIEMLGSSIINSKTKKIIDMCSKLTDETLPHNISIHNVEESKIDIPDWAIKDKDIYLKMISLMEKVPTRSEFEGNKEYMG